MANPDDQEFDDIFDNDEFAEPVDEMPDLDLGLEAELDGERLEPLDQPEDFWAGETDFPEDAAEPAVAHNGHSNGNGQGPQIERRRTAQTAPRRPSRPRSPAAAKEHPPEGGLGAALAAAAEKAPSASEAALLIAALVPLALQPAGPAAAALATVLPVLMQGAAGAARVMYRQPASRPYLRWFPEIVELTVRRLFDSLNRAEPLTPEQAADVLAEVTGEVIQRRHRSR